MNSHPVTIDLPLIKRVIKSAQGRARWKWPHFYMRVRMCGSNEWRASSSDGAALVYMFYILSLALADLAFWMRRQEFDSLCVDIAGELASKGMPAQVFILMEKHLVERRRLIPPDDASARYDELVSSIVREFIGEVFSDDVLTSLEADAASKLSGRMVFREIAKYLAHDARALFTLFTTGEELAALQFPPEHLTDDRNPLTQMIRRPKPRHDALTLDFDSVPIGDIPGDVQTRGTRTVAVRLEKGTVCERSGWWRIEGAFRIDATSQKWFRPRDPTLRDTILKQFRETSGNRDWTEAAFRALEIGNLRFFRSPMMTKAPIEGDDQARWDVITGSAQAGDLLMVRDGGSKVSSIIAGVDRGDWSHVALYLHDGWIGEMLTTGYVIRPVEAYRTKPYRVGLFRWFHSLDRALERVLFDFATHSPQYYSYAGAAVAGIAAFVGFHGPTGPTTPNGLLYSGRFHRVV